jgi:ATP/maltotriose-dependent transcriptional regulator MalT
MADVAALSVGIAEVLGTIGEPRPDLVERVRILAAGGHDARGLAKATSTLAPGADALLVVDDYHFALGSADAEAFFEELLALTEFRLLIATRERPSWLEPRKVVYGEAAVLEVEALAFTDEEAAAVLGDGREDAVSYARGWPAVIGLAAMRGDVEGASGLSPDDLYRFFAEDLLRSASDELRDAMLLLALAGGDSARFLLGPKHARLVAEATERGFLTSSGRPSIHPLLRSFLLAKLGELDEARVDEFVRRAVEYLADNQRWGECLFVLERFPNDELILATLKQGLAPMLDSGRTATLGSWAELAETRGKADPVVLLAGAEVAVRQSDNSRAHVLGEQAGGLLSGDLAARAYLAAARGAHFCDAEEEARRLCELALDQCPTPPTQLDVLWTKFTIARERSASEALELLSRMTGLGTTVPLQSIRSAAAEGMWLSDYGSVTRALGVLERARASMSSTRDPFARTGLLEYLGYAYLVAARYDEALDVARDQAVEAREAGLSFVIDHATLRSAAACVGLRRFAEARSHLLDLNSRSGALSAFVRDNVRLLEVRLRIAVGDLAIAGALLDGDFDRVHRPAFHGELAAYRALVAAATGELDGAREALEQDEQCFRFGEAECLRDLAQAVMSLKGSPWGKSPSAAVEKALGRGQMDVLVTAFRAYPPLVGASAQDAATRRAVANILARSRDGDIAKSAGLKTSREIRPREKLSAREREVYELLVQGRTNHDIARALFISLSTTKVHVRHIYEKLGVHSRVEAAALGPLPDD